LPQIATEPAGFVVCPNVLLSVHPEHCAAHHSYLQRLLGGAGSAPDSRSTGARGVPAHPADLMLRMINHRVDGFLALRRDLSAPLDHWQAQLLDPSARVANWSALLQARRTLHQLEDVCEDQRSAMTDWLEDALQDGAGADTHLGSAERDLLQVRCRDVIEHIERVAHHVRQLEQNAETAVQIHFTAQSHRTNEIMRTLTVLTAIFLPLNLLAGIFGMNFDAIPLLHRADGFWWAIGSMVALALGSALLFWRKRYLTHTTG
jgi:Mg2+ and Co2+ transporter CorA